MIGTAHLFRDMLRGLMPRSARSVIAGSSKQPSVETKSVLVYKPHQMTDSTRQADALLTDHFTYTPLVRAPFNDSFPPEPANCRHTVTHRRHNQRRKYNRISSLGRPRGRSSQRSSRAIRLQILPIGKGLV